MNEIVFDTSGLTEEQVSLYQTAVIDTLDKLGIKYEYDETTPDLKKYTVKLKEPR